MSGVPGKAVAHAPEADASGVGSPEAGVPVRGPSAPAVPGAAVPEYDAPKDGTPERGAPEPLVPGPVGIDELLERVRAGYERIGPAEAAEAAAAGALLVDIRYAALRERDGLIPGALVVERNELEWRLDPRAVTVPPRRSATICGSSSSATRATPPVSRSPRYGSWGCTGPPI